MKSFHFSVGNSTVGPVGFCARIQADSKERALDILRAALPEELDTKLETLSPNDMTNQGVEYINVYFNAGPITTDDIDSTDPLSSKEDRCCDLIAALEHAECDLRVLAERAGQTDDPKAASLAQSAASNARAAIAKAKGAPGGAS